jgi:hypothetical protein
MGLSRAVMCSSLGTGWAKRGALPFRVIDKRQAARHARDFQHIVIDTQARPSREDLEALAGGCDLLVIPSTPDALALDALMLTDGGNTPRTGCRAVQGPADDLPAETIARRRGGPPGNRRGRLAAVRWRDPPRGCVPEGGASRRRRVVGQGPARDRGLGRLPTDRSGDPAMSRFKGILDSAKHREPEPVTVPEPTPSPAPIAVAPTPPPSPALPGGIRKTRKPGHISSLIVKVEAAPFAEAAGSTTTRGYPGTAIARRLPAAVAMPRC